MPQPASPTNGLPTLGTIPLRPDEPDLFADAMQRIIRRLGESAPPGRTATLTGLPMQQSGHQPGQQPGRPGPIH